MCHVGDSHWTALDALLLPLPQIICRLRLQLLASSHLIVSHSQLPPHRGHGMQRAAAESAPRADGFVGLRRGGRRGRRREAMALPLSLGSSSFYFYSPLAAPAPHPARSSRAFGSLLLGRRKCRHAGRNCFRCSRDDKVAVAVAVSRTHGVSTQLLSCLAASLVFISPPCQAVPAETFVQPNSCQIATIAAIDKDAVPLKFEGPSDDGGAELMMMRGMTAKNFDPVRYSGRWFEVASLKRGFAGQGQEDCHCTQGVYSFDEKSRSIQVDTFCVHGGPDGYITGIRGRVQCLSEEDMASAETDLERQEMIRGKCFLRFPTLPFIPKEPYDVLATDYDNYAVVSGAKDTSFIQIYSRTPNPGPEFIDKYKTYAANFGYDPSKIKDTPQDCEAMSSDQLALMMSMPGMNEALTNQFPDLKLNAAVALDPFTSVLDTLKKLVELYFK
ncbi:hypothetical protein GUJ93_ZPchr0004g39974 [Zizania palustris]|uniref:Lipocalin/cytosolic fatty-acid binding domain-containing protein n=1 Tax=Zizania palustris TaxID=103762 RepID=A0A8J5S7G0_ZIZPA|nr:hypothetical protein GUJ93_ZPchr0004g39974 [Zizania palustris]